MKQRIVGVDVARGLAVLGMFAAHLGHSVDGEPVPSWFVVADGRPSALFAILAGLSIGLFTGGRTPPSGPRLAHGWLRVLSRAAVIFAIGIFLMALETPIAVILPSYAVTFVLIAPALGVRPVISGFLAGAVALLGPTLLAALITRTAEGTTRIEQTFGTADSFVLDLFLTGYYPALVWAAYMLLGLCLGRLDLRSVQVQVVMGLTGLALILAGHGGADLLQATLTADTAFTQQLLSAEPHSDSTFEVVANSGVALLLLSVLLLATTLPALARGARLVLYPVAATGSMALTAYSVHIVAIAILGDGVVWRTESNAVLGWFVLVTLVACTLWARFIGRGPLEWLMRVITVGSFPTTQRTVSP